MSTKHPKQWQTRRLGEVVDILDNKRVPLNASERAERPGTVPYYGATGQAGWIDASIFDEELVLLGEDGAPFFDASRAVAYLINGPAWVNNHAHVLRGSSGLRNRFLLYQLNQVDYHPYVSGTTRAKLPQGPMREIPLLVPSLPDQDRIVAAIEAHFSCLDAAEQGLKRVQAKLKHARASVLKAAVEGRLVPTEAALARAEGRRYEPASALLARVLAERRARWAERGERGKYKEPVAPETEGLPEGWCAGSVGDVTDVSGGFAKNAGKVAGSITVPFLRVANVYANELRLDDVHTIGVSDAELERLRLVSGDLLIVEGNGSADQLGRVAVWNGVVDPCIHQNHLIRARPEESVLSKWLLFWLMSPPGRRAIQDNASSTSGLHTLSISKIQRLPLLLPPLAEQARIVAEVDRRLSVLDQVEALVGRSLTRCASLRQSILKRAFEGRLVPPSAEVTPE